MSYSSSIPSAAVQPCEPPWKLYRCPADTAPVTIEDFVEVPTPIAEALNDFLLQMEEGDGFAHLHLYTCSWKGQKIQIRWAAAMSKQGYFDRPTFDGLFQ